MQSVSLGFPHDESFLPPYRLFRSRGQNILKHMPFGEEHDHCEKFDCNINQLLLGFYIYIYHPDNILKYYIKILGVVSLMFISFGVCLVLHYYFDFLYISGENCLFLITAVFVDQNKI